MSGYYNAQSVTDYVELNPSLPTLKKRGGINLNKVEFKFFSGTLPIK